VESLIVCSLSKLPKAAPKKVAKKEQERLVAVADNNAPIAATIINPKLHEAGSECVQRHTDRDCGQQLTQEGRSK
jgi:hypothetical protein